VRSLPGCDFGGPGTATGLANSTLRNLLSGAYLRLGCATQRSGRQGAKMGLITPFLSKDFDHGERYPHPGAGSISKERCPG
jgi:hypothetical protein